MPSLSEKIDSLLYINMIYDNKMTRSQAIDRIIKNFGIEVKDASIYVDEFLNKLMIIKRLKKRK